MSTTPSPHPIRRTRVWRWILAGIGCSFAAAAVVAYNLITLNSTATALRDELVSSSSLRTHVRVQGSIGPVALSAVRAGLHFVHSVPRDAVVALSSVSKASVGVYALEHPASESDRAKMFTSVDRMMQKKHWTRTVAVSQPDTFVLVYVPETMPSKAMGRVCLAVVSRDHLVIVSGDLRMKPLEELGLQQHLLARR